MLVIALPEYRVVESKTDRQNEKSVGKLGRDERISRSSKKKEWHARNRRAEGTKERWGGEVKKKEGVLDKMKENEGVGKR